MNNHVFGLIMGLMVPLLALVIFYLVSNPGTSLAEFLEVVLARKKLSSLISLSVVPDLLLFFIFIWLNYLYSARGVLAAVFILALIVVLTKFLV